MDNNRWIVVTTIQAPTAAMEAIARLAEKGWHIVVIGDTKTPVGWKLKNTTYLSVDEQLNLFSKTAEVIPVQHYSRKNLGYLYAISHGAKVILETDDDNFPGDEFGAVIAPQVTGESVSHQGWVNVYRYFSDALIWPRGLSLKAIHSAPPLQAAAPFDCPIQQGLADEDPDVDAIYRLLFTEAARFTRRPPVVLQPGAWCPFNSQNTLFFPVAFPLLYLPCQVSFRMTDIWRSFVAQACLWAHGLQISFHAASVWQVRNDHDLLKDFGDEVPGYLGNDEIVRVLGDEVSKGPETTMASTAHRMWRALVGRGFVPEAELPILEAWFDVFAAGGS